MKKILMLLFCLLLIGCGTESRDFSQYEDFNEATYCDTSDDDNYSMLSENLNNILNIDFSEWKQEDYHFVLNTPRIILYEIGNIEDKWALGDNNVGMGTMHVVFRQRFYDYGFLQSRIGFYRYLDSQGSENDVPLFIFQYLSDATVQDIFAKYGITNINEYLYEDTRPAGGTGYYVYDIYYHQNNLIYIFDTDYYGPPLSEKMPQTP